MARTDGIDDFDKAFVVRDGCPACGFDPISPGRLAGRIREQSGQWWELLHAADAARSPAPGAWSAIELGGHLLDVTAAFDDRLTRVLARDGADFPGIEGPSADGEAAHADADPDLLADQLDAALEAVAQRLATVPDEAWNHRGQRSDGAAFTLASLGNHFLHELEHHATQVRGALLL